jgi:hypothetical protein
VFLGSVSNEVLRTFTRDVLLISPAAIRRSLRDPVHERMNLFAA